MRTWLFQQIDYKHYKYGSKNRFEMIFFCNCEMRITHNTQGFPRLFGESGQIDHLIPEQIDHFGKGCFRPTFRSKLTTCFPE